MGVLEDQVQMEIDPKTYKILKDIPSSILRVNMNILKGLFFFNLLSIS